MNKRIAILLGLVITAFAIWSLLTSSKLVSQLIDRLENIGYDLQLRTRVFSLNEKPIDNVAIIDIDDKSLEVEGRWPWSRSKIATLVKKLEEQRVVVVAFDILFSEPENNILTDVLHGLGNQQLTEKLSKDVYLFNNDAILAKTIAKNSIILALTFLPRPETQNQLPPPLFILKQQEMKDFSLYKAKGYITNIPLIQQAAKGAGFINVFADQDGIIRRAPFVMQFQNHIYPALSLQAVIEFLGEKPILVTGNYDHKVKLEGIALGGRVIPTDEKGQVLVPFIGNNHTFPYFSATDVLHGHIPKNSLLGKIVFIGTTATGLADFHATAIQPHFPGLEIQASLANGILKNNFYYQPAWAFGVTFFLTVVLGILSAFIFPFLGPRSLGAVIILIPPLLLSINNWIMIETKLVLSFFIPIIVTIVIAIFNLLYGYLFETRKREQLKEMFGQYVPAKHIDAMLKAPADYGLQGEEREMSVLFADIRSFTSLSENMTAKDLVNMLNAFFTPMTAIIFKHKGTIDKYVGDLIMAFWGAPLKDKHHAKHAILSALEMQAKVSELKPFLNERGWPAIHIGIGINSGKMSVGDMGSKFRRNYTVLGDEVNLASRVESLSKFYGVNIVVTENTKKDQTQFLFRQLDKVKVKGKKNSVAIFEVLGQLSQSSQELVEEIASYHDALGYYFAKEWEKAKSILLKLKATHPNTKIYDIYLERIVELQKTPLPQDWDGVYIHEHK